MALNGRFHLHFYPGLGRRIREVSPDIIHIDEEPYNLATFQAMWLGRRAGAATLFFTWQNLRRHYPAPFSWIERYVLRRADAAIAGNQEAVQVLKAKGYRGPVELIPQFGVDPELYTPATDQTERTDRTFTIGYVGRLVQAKGVDLLLNAAAGLQGEWQLRIMGSGPQQEALQTQARRAGARRPRVLRSGKTVVPGAGLSKPTRRPRSALADADQLEGAVWARAD